MIKEIEDYIGFKLFGFYLVWPIKQNDWNSREEKSKKSPNPPKLFLLKLNDSKGGITNNLNLGLVKKKN